MSKILIIGRGYSGKFLERALATSEHEVRFTRREDPNAIRLDLSDPSTWQFQDSFDYTCWLAPSPSPDLVDSFLQKKRSQLGKIICCSSTGFFLNPSELHAEVNESSPLDLANPRVQAENILLKEADAMIVHAAGIYGPNRNPQNWLASGSIQPSAKLLNLIHVGDLVLFFCKSLSKYQARSRWVLSDGHPKSWNQLYQAWAESLRLPQLSEGSSEGSKRVNPKKTFEVFNFSPVCEDVFQGISRGMKEDNVLQTILHHLET